MGCSTRRSFGRYWNLFLIRKDCNQSLKNESHKIKADLSTIVDKSAFMVYKLIQIYADPLESIKSKWNEQCCRNDDFLYQHNSSSIMRLLST